MDDAHDDVNVKVSKRERAREPNRLAGLAYVLIRLGGLEGPLWLQNRLAVK